MVVLLSLCSAVAYGLSDFIGGLVARRTSAWSVAVVVQFCGTAATALVALTRHGAPTGADLGFAVVAGVGGGLGVGFLYRGLAAGRMSVVAPISAVGAAVLPALVGVVSGERPSVLATIGLVAALPGIWLVSSSPEDVLHADQRAPLAEGVVDGLLAGLGFGVLFAALGQVGVGAGLWPLTLAQAVSMLASALLATILRARWVPRDRAPWRAAIAGPLGAVAVVAFTAATHRGLLTVASVLASLYPAVTILLAATILRERIHATQGVGLALCGAAVALVAAG
jgi:uncharacterized membrane protein